MHGRRMRDVKQDAQITGPSGLDVWFMPLL